MRAPLKKQLLAIHEAGHFAIAMVYNFPVRRVSLWPSRLENGSEAEGHCALDDFGGDFWEQLLFHLAGLAGEAIWSGKCPKLGDCCDWMEAQRIASESTDTARDRDALLKDAWQAVGEFLRQPAVWRGVCWLSEQLLIYGTLPACDAVAAFEEGAASDTPAPRRR